MSGELLVYGSYGYIGALVARTAVDEGLSPVIAGRRADRVEEQALELGVDHRVFTLDHPDVVRQHVADFDAVLNCAGPFSRTAAQLRTACLREGTDYLDLAGEIDVLEAAAELDREAEQADVVILPGVGFDVVPTDCLAAHLESRLPSATSLTLAMDGLGTFSPGTLKSILEELPQSGVVRENGELRTVPAAWRTRRFDFGRGEKTGVTVPWGDVSAAYYTTGIKNIEVYATVPEFAVNVMRRTRPLVPVLATRPGQRLLTGAVDALVSGPTAQERAQSANHILGEVEDDEGNRVATRLKTPDTYDFAAQASVESTRRVLDGEVSAGFQTPASAFGSEFVTEFDGIEREDLDTALPLGSSVGATERE
ncbi:saccharopine dehydrogenase family protein [Haloprofundus salilacus]|uniref:saccharopine dehydrogenase family protein n=1 Tax=Haloprofundus salilacus TaxID=2876190 RepID=UPI001CCD187F|nr:saccharopine dehydrogenase NADP-binding domain-containing protein [Haloprofundus salilacus]